MALCTNNESDCGREGEACEEDCRDYQEPTDAPSILVWGANPGYLVAPTNAAVLSVAANDAELDMLAYHWSAEGDSGQPIAT
jgi:hypothetical protein